MANKWKTGSTAKVTMELDISGEVLATLPQILWSFYYVAVGGKKIIFSIFAKDPNEPGIAGRAAATDPPITLHPVVINGSTVTMTVPPEDTETLEIEDCEEVPVFTEIGWEDDFGDKNKGLEVDEDEEDEACDPVVGTLIGSVSEGLL